MAFKKNIWDQATYAPKQNSIKVTGNNCEASSYR